MNLKQKKKEIMQRYYPISGLIVICLLGIMGVGFVFLSGIFSVHDSTELYDCVSEYGLMIIFGAFFFVASVYCWINIIMNVVINPKKSLMYLSRNDEGEFFFLNKKGKKFIYEKRDKMPDKYYYVMHSHNYIYDVVEECDADFEDFSKKEKKSFWMNAYTPIGNFEDIMLLPIIYVVLLPGVLAFIMAEGFSKLWAVAYGAGPIYYIIYDLLYKNKLKKNGGLPFDDSNFLNLAVFFKKLLAIGASGILMGVFIYLFYNMGDVISKIIFLPFLAIALFQGAALIARVFGKRELVKALNKLSFIVFFAYWFGIVIFWTIGIVKQESNYLYVLFSIPFWIIGIWGVYKFIIKDKE